MEYLKRWMWIQIACVVPMAVMLLTFKILPESPRWLVATGRQERAKEILEDMAKVNGR